MEKEYGVKKKDSSRVRTIKITSSLANFTGCNNNVRKSRESQSKEKEKKSKKPKKE